MKPPKESTRTSTDKADRVEADPVQADLEEYRGLMEPPERFEDGMTARTVLGGFFIGFLMMPGAIYMGLMAGSSLGPAAEWVTIILFAEVARRSFAPLGRQEIYVLYYIAGGLTHVIAGAMLAGGPFGTLADHHGLAGHAGGCRQVASEGEGLERGVGEGAAVVVAEHEHRHAERPGFERLRLLMPAPPAPRARRPRRRLPPGPRRG